MIEFIEVPSLIDLVQCVLKEQPSMPHETAIAIGTLAQAAFEDAENGLFHLPLDHEPRHAISIAAEYLRFIAYGD